MAVYKATHCYPMLNSLDIRLTSTKAEPKPASYLKCKIDTSNKEITGYSIRILDENNNQIFPYSNGDAVVSPLSELSVLDNDDMVNSGYNGTFINVPFFQCNNNNFYTSTGPRTTTSYNAVYYQALTQANYIIEDREVSASQSDGYWYYDSATSTMKKDGWDGTLNEEKCLVGEVVLIQTTDAAKDTCGGLWEFKQNGSLQRYTLSYGTVSKDMTLSNLNGNGVLIISGTHHNTVYTYNSSSRTWDSTSNNGWVDYANHSINLSNTGNTYKWEITLYQGEGTVVGTTLQYMNYSNMSYDWYDMILQTGTILGSTPKRIQLGSKVPGSDPTENFIPNGTDSDALVIQGRYIELYNSDANFNSSTKLGNSRAYINSYDASYGHVYPETTAFSEQNIKAAVTARIFKYSNNYDAIEASDIVKCATTANIGGLYPQYTADATYTFFMIGAPVSTSTGVTGTLNIDGGTPVLNDTVLSRTSASSSTYKLYKVTSIEYDSESQDKQITSITYTEQSFTFDANKYYYISSGDKYGNQYRHGSGFLADAATGLITIDGYQLVEGDLVLVKDQTNAKENGVYVAHAEGSTNTRWTRSGSFNSWGDFIGKILFVQYGTTNGSKNFESIANAGGTLYDNSASSGSSPLYFTEEKPLILYKQSVYRNDINLVAPANTDPRTLMTIDGVPVALNMLIYSNYNITGSGTYGSVVQVTSLSTSSWSGSVVEQISEVKQLYITDGKVYGHGVISTVTRSSTTTIALNLNLYRAYVQKNTTQYTYISPYVNLHKGSALKLQNNKTVTYSSDSSVSQWIKVNELYKGNGTYTGVWCIQHNALSSALKSFGESEPDVPYTYEVRSYYRASDETVFYTYEEPYLKLTYNGEGYSDIITWQPYQVAQTAHWDEYDVLSQASSTTWLNFMVGNISLSAIAQRYVTLQGDYIQFQQLSWVSYRWVLTDIDGNILQDTGKKFDRKMEVSFYGLSNDEDNNVYYAILYVEDALKKTLTFTVKLIVSPDTVSSLNLPFHATFDCQTHSILLEYDDMGFVVPSVPYSYDEAIEYIKDNENLIVYWDDSVKYENDKVYITNKNKTSTVPVFNMDSTDQITIAGLSYTEQMGLQYHHYYPSDGVTVKDNTHNLIMENDEFAMETIINLDDNYEGDFLSIDMDGPSKSEFVRLALAIPAATASNTTFSAYRFNIQGRLEAIHGDSVLSSVRSTYIKNSSGVTYRWDGSTYDTTKNPYFTLQPTYLDLSVASRVIDDCRDFQYLLTAGNDNYPWYFKKNNSDNKIVYAPNINTLVGNLCLVKTTDITIDGSSVSAADLKEYSKGSFGYWMEEQHYIKAQAVSTAQIVTTNAVEFHAMTSDAPGTTASTLYWPNTDETNAYWVEVNWGTSEVPIQDLFYCMYPNQLSSWSSLEDTYISMAENLKGMCAYRAIAKYYNVLSKKTWKITIRLQNVTNLYNALSGGSTITFGNPSTADTYGFKISVNTTEYGQVIFEEV